MKKQIIIPIAIASLLLAATAGAQELFSVNLWGPGRANQAGDTEYKRADWLRTLRLEDGQTSGVWQTSQWTNLNVATIAVNGTATITGSESSPATFKILNKRNQSAYRWTVLRDGTTDPTINAAYMTDGVATLIDGKVVGTEINGAGDTFPTPSVNAVIEVSGLTLPVYDVIFYFTMNYDQFGSGADAGKGYIDFNNTGLKEWKLPVGDNPTRLLPTTFTEIINSGDTGNYIHYKNVTGSSFTARVYGKGFNHGGIAGFQILEVDTVVGAVDPDVSTVVASPVYVPADDSSTSTVTVTLKDSIGIPVPGKNVTLATGGAAVINPAAPVETNAEGKAIFTVKSASSGAQVFTATNVTDDDQVITQTATVNFVGLADVGLSTVVASSDSVVANGSVTSTITVSLKDSNGFPAGGRSVTLAGSPGNAMINPAGGQITNTNGVATFTVSSSSIGTEVFTATADAQSISQTASVVFVDPATPFAINVNFEQFTPGPGTFAVKSELFGPAGGLASIWNQFAANSSSGALLDPAGIATGVAFTTNFSEGRSDGTGATPMLRSTLTDFGRGAARTFTITGLSPGALYDIWLTSFRNQPSAIERTYGRWTANNPTSSNSVQFIDNRDGQNGTTFVEGYNYAVFKTVVADETGNISFSGKGMMAADGADGDYRLGLSGFQIVPVGKAVITSFSAPGATTVIDQTAKTISLTVPAGTNLATLAPTFTLSSGICNPTSGAPPSPTFAVQNPATYTVTDDSTDPDTVNAYTVTVTVLAPPPPTTTLVIDLGTSPAGTLIAGGQFIGSGPVNLPIPALPSGSILRSIDVDAKLESTSGDSFASDLAVLLDTNPPTTGDNFALGITSTSGTTVFGPTSTLTWTGGNGGPGTPLVESKTASQWGAQIDLATTGVFLGNTYGNSDGTWSGTITLTYDVVSPGTPFENWAEGAPFDGDANGDGVSNGLAFLLGAANPGANALGLLPSVSKDPAGLVLSFNMLNADSRGDAALKVEHSSDLGLGDPWLAVAVPETSGSSGGVSFNVTAGNPLNSVTATIPGSEASDGKLFGRLSAEEN
jgi:hypothetical protein